LDQWSDFILRLSFVENLPARIIDELLQTLQELSAINIQHLRLLLRQNDISLNVQELMLNNLWICKYIFIFLFFKI